MSETAAFIHREQLLDEGAALLVELLRDEILQGTADEVPNAELMRFLNRLSDVLWLLARWEEQTQA